MKVSIIIPIFNVAQFITRCLQSVAVQTYDDIECILVDDCGTDESMHIVEQFIHDYKGNINFRIVHHEQNRGISAARNTGIKTTDCDYIYFMDSDDAITPDCIETLTNLAKKYPEANYIQGETISDSEILNNGKTDADVPEYCTERPLLEEIILEKTHRTAWNKLIKRSFLINNALFFPEGIIMEDHYWTYFASKCATAVSFTHKGTYYYYINKDSLVNSPTKASCIIRYKSYMTITKVIINDLLQRNNIKSYHRLYLGETIVFCMYHLARLHSLSHWFKFWIFVWQTAYNLKSKFTWQRLLFFICMMPPICLMTGVNGCRWRIRQYVITKI